MLNINTLIEEVGQLLHSDFIAKQVSLRVHHLATDLPQIMSDPVQVRQALIKKRYLMIRPV